MLTETASDKHQVSVRELNIHLYISQQENDVICGNRLYDKCFPKSLDPDTQIQEIYGKNNQLSLHEQTLML